MVVKTLCLYLYMIINKQKQNAMKTIETRTGKTRKELEIIYINAVKMLVEFGATPQQAREIVKESLRNALGL